MYLPLLFDRSWDYLLALLVSASPRRQSFQFATTVHAGLHRQLLDRYFYKLSSFNKVEMEAQRWQLALLMARRPRRRWMQKENSADFCKDLTVISMLVNHVFVRADFI